MHRKTNWGNAASGCSCCPDIGIILRREGWTTGVTIVKHVAHFNAQTPLLRFVVDLL